MHVMQNLFLDRRSGIGKLLSLLVCSFFLTSCLTALSTDTEVTIWKGEKWKIVTEIMLSTVDVQTYGLMIDQSFNEYISELVAEGIDAEWQKGKQSQDEGVTYQITIEGVGYEKLNQAAFSGKHVFTVDESSGERLVHFRYRPGTDLFAMVLEEKYTINGGKIISSNGTQTDHNTVTWVNPTTTMEAIFTEASRYSWMLYLTIGLLIAIAGWFAYQYFSKHSAPSISPVTYTPELSPSSRFCPHCGTEIPKQASFCPQCGSNL